MKSDQSSIHLVSANLGRWLGLSVPDAVAAAARESLAENDRAKRLRGVRVTIFGDDLHLATFNGAFPPGEDPNAYVFGLA
jgi:hypothetical protein